MNENYTPEQKIFISGQRKLKKYEELSHIRPLTAVEHGSVDKIKEILWSRIVRFAMSEAGKMMSKYALPSDAYAEIQQELALTFYEKLSDYDPTISAPTTYFVRYFHQAIASYLRRDSQHLSQYDARNLSKIRRAINHYEASGITWTLDMIANRTSLSPKVVNMTIHIGQNSKHAELDETFNMKANSPTPEESYLLEERKRILVDALSSRLSDDELRLFLYRVNPDGQKEMPYDKVAKEMGMSVREVKQSFSRIIAKLRNDSRLSALYQAKRTKEDSGLKFQDHAVDIIIDCIETSFS